MLDISITFVAARLKKRCFLFSILLFKENFYPSQKHSQATKLNIQLLIIEHLLQDVLQSPEGQRAHTWGPSLYSLVVLSLVSLFTLEAKTLKSS